MKNEAKPLRMSLGMGRSIQIQPTLKTSPVEAAYRTALRRMFVAAGRTPAPWNVSIERQEQAIKELAVTAPGIVSRGVDKLAKRSASTWEWANDVRYSVESRQECEQSNKHFRLVVERICQLFSIRVDWFGALPGYCYSGICYHDALSALRASVEGGGK